MKTTVDLDVYADLLEASDALQELVDLKDLEHQIQEGGPNADPNGEFSLRRAFAWERAKEVVEALRKPK